VSVASVVIGLAAQNTLGKVIAGFALLLYRPFRISDRVQIAGLSRLATGTVESLSLGYTIVRGDDGRRFIVPNSTMATQVAVNLNDVKAGEHSMRSSAPVACVARVPGGTSSSDEAWQSGSATCRARR
jgi:hypothetical protein